MKNTRLPNPTTIEQAKREKIFPMRGIPVRIKLMVGTCNLIIKSVPGINPLFVNNREDEAKGIYLDFIGGGCEEYWWVKHENGSIGVYYFKEIFDL